VAVSARRLANLSNILKAQPVSSASRRAGSMRTRAAPVADACPHGMVNLSLASTMHATLNRLGGPAIEQFTESKFVQPQSIMYGMDGDKRKW
jgi:hypothetical protein